VTSGAALAAAFRLLPRAGGNLAHVMVGRANVSEPAARMVRPLRGWKFDMM
jgi:hypothetical protein